MSTQTVLITGCSAGGIGSALAEAFQARGLHVFATARSLSKMSHLEKLPNTTLLELDVESPDSIAAALDAVTAKTGGKLNYLINNSGQSLVVPILDADIAQAKKLFDVNFWGVVAVTGAFAPLVIAAKGKIVNVASLAAVLHVPWNSFYSASKSALKSYGETLRLELAPLGVKVITVMTGVVGTHLTTNAPRVELPADSPYKGATKEIHNLASGAWIENAMPARVYAEKVVGDVLGSANGLTWRGKMASMGWLITGFFPGWFIDRSLVSGSGLEHV